MELENERKANIISDSEKLIDKPTTPIHSTEDSILESNTVEEDKDGNAEKTTNNHAESSLENDEQATSNQYKEISTSVTEPEEGSKLTENKEVSKLTENIEGSKLTENKEESEANEDTPKVESFAAAMNTTTDIGSRFYIKRRIIVGNVSKFMIPGKLYQVNADKKIT